MFWNRKAETKEVRPTLEKKLMLIMSEVGGLEKDARAPDIAGGYDYYSITGIENALRPAMARHGVIAVPSIVDSKVDDIQGIPKARRWAWVRIRVAFFDVDRPSCFGIVVYSEGEGIDNRDKAIGSAYSYAVKAAYRGVFHLGGADNEQFDHGSQQPKKQERSRSKPEQEQEQDQEPVLPAPVEDPPEVNMPLVGGDITKDAITVVQASILGSSGVIADASSIREVGSAASNNGWTFDDANSVLAAFGTSLPELPEDSVKFVKRMFEKFTPVSSDDRQEEGYGA